MPKRTASALNRIRSTVVAIFLVVGGVCILGSGELAVSIFSQARRQTPRLPAARAAARPARYSQFPHDVQAHRKECTSCHTFPSSNWKTVRAEADAFPDVTQYPQHESCVGCHKQQFFKGATPVICSICHATTTPSGGTRHPFYNPRETFDRSPKAKNARADFAIAFPHATHIEIVSQVGQASSPFRNASFDAKRVAEESCAVCHKTLNPQGTSDDEFLTKPPADIGENFWVKKGTFKSVPIRHSTCFTCHNADSGIVPVQTNCATCHKYKTPDSPADFDAKTAAAMGVSDRVTLDAWRRRVSAGKFRHEFVAHVDLECATCHTVEKIDTTQAATRRVPISACATCHATATTDDGGVINFEMDARAKDPKFNCARCHLSFGTKPVPASHTQAIEAAK
jgi:LSD1 subclass zinc finger protein